MDAQYSVSTTVSGTGADRVRTSALIHWSVPPRVVASVQAPGPGKDSKVWLQNMDQENAPSVMEFLKSSATSSTLVFDSASNSAVHQFLADLPVKISVKRGATTVRTPSWETVVKLVQDLNDEDVTVKFS